MKKCGSWPISVCTWSLALSGIHETARAVNDLGVDHVHLAVAPALEAGGNAYLEEVRRQGWTVTATMIAFAEEDYSSPASIRATGGIRPNATWEKNRRLVGEAMDVTAGLGVPYLSFHIGFIDRPGSESWGIMQERARVLARQAAAANVQLLLETGQETAEELLLFLGELDQPAVGVNFDPANMILYDMGDPVEAVAVLGPLIRHVHIKDGTRPKAPGAWGVQTPWGEGQVDEKGFFEALGRIGYTGALAVERESGNRRSADIRTAIDRLSAFGR